MNRLFVVVGNPENRRVAFFQSALVRQGLPSALVLGYRELLAGHQSLEQPPRNAFLRIESPGENFEVERGLLALGAAAAASEGSPHLPREACRRLEEDRGRLWHPRQWYLGYCEFLRWLTAAIGSRSDLRLVSWPADIEVMFDKGRCHQRLEAAGIPVPPSLGRVSCFDELVAAMASARTDRVFVKLAHGSSASGVVALERRRNSWFATTTVEMERGHGHIRLYNALKVRRYAGFAEVGELIDALAPHRIHVERWLPKATLEGRVFDLRVVLVGGEPQHVVVRTSRGPITNLHLGNRRGNLDRLLAIWPEDSYLLLLDTCRAVGRQFAGSLSVGLDLLVTPGSRQHYVLEVNAFGDLLPRVMHNNRDTYEAQVAAALALGLSID